jgi:hypothetical protein
LSLAIGAQAGGMLAFGAERDRSTARARSEKDCACPEPVLAENPSFGIGQISLTERNARLPSFCRRGGGADVAWHGEKRLLSRACLGKSLLFARGHETSTNTSVFAGDAGLLSRGCRHPSAVYAAAAGARSAAEFCNTILISMRTPINCQDRLETGQSKGGRFKHRRSSRRTAGAWSPRWCQVTQWKTRRLSRGRRMVRWRWRRRRASRERISDKILASLQVGCNFTISVCVAGQ